MYQKLQQHKYVDVQKQQTRMSRYICDLTGIGMDRPKGKYTIEMNESTLEISLTPNMLVNKQGCVSLITIDKDDSKSLEKYEDAFEVSNDAFDKVVYKLYTWWG